MAETFSDASALARETMAELLIGRRQSADARLNELREDLPHASTLVRTKACVYLTGSFARGEASEYSDVDLFIVGRGNENNRALTRLDEILVKAELIKATRDLGFPELLGIFSNRRTVTPEDTDAMVRLSPTARLQWLPADGGFASTKSIVDNILEHYEQFLIDTDAPEDELVERFLNPGFSRKFFQSANHLGDQVFELLGAIGDDNAFHRLLVV